MALKLFDIDDKIEQLAMNMKAVFGFLQDVNSLQYKIQSLEDNLELALKQIIETTSFIGDYYHRNIIGMSEPFTICLFLWYSMWGCI